MIPKNTPYKVIKYLVKIENKKCLPIHYKEDPLIIYLIDRGFLQTLNDNIKKYCITNSFNDLFLREILPCYEDCDLFIKKFHIENLENHYTISDFKSLIQIDADKLRILSFEFSFQWILTEYFGSSKYRKINSILADAIKKILDIETFPEETKKQQYLSILYSENESKYIMLCENKNRLIIPRHSFIEFWYVGGKNINQLQFAPSPELPIFYLCDWDYDGLKTYIEIKQKYFPSIKIFIPENFKTLSRLQEEVKEHHSKWINRNYFKFLNEREKDIANFLFEAENIIEEQRIVLNQKNLLTNGITIKSSLETNYL